jgi:nucleotide-binding universal stress UspA family protein
MSIQSLLCPTDFSETAGRALQQALLIARAHRAGLRLFHAVVIPAGAEDPDLLPGGQVDRMLADAGQRLGEESEALRAGGLEVSSSVVRAVSASDAILQCLEELRPNLVVMGTQGRTGVAKLLMGSVAEEVVRHARCNVMTLRKDAAIAEGPFQRILVPVDFNDCSRRALEAARALVADASALMVLHVVESPIRPCRGHARLSPIRQVDPELPTQVQKDLEHWVEGDMRETEVTIAEGDVAAEILGRIDEKKAQLVVMGTRGLTGLDRFLMGSVAVRVVREAAVPVLTVK